MRVLLALLLLSSDGTAKETKTETREVMNLYDATYSRLIRKDGEELSPKQARAEQARFDKAVGRRAHEPAEAKAKREEAERKRAAENLVCEQEFFSVFDTRLSGTAEINGRAVWLVELDPRPGANPHCAELKLYGKFKVKLWIDRQEYRTTRLEADNISPVTWGAFLIRLPTGGLHLVSEQQRHADGVWLPSSEEARVTAKALLAIARLVPAGGN